MRQLFFVFSHGFSLEIELVSVVNQTVKDRIGECGVADAVVPFFGRQLAPCTAAPTPASTDSPSPPTNPSPALSQQRRQRLAHIPRGHPLQIQQPRQHTLHTRHALDIRWQQGRGEMLALVAPVPRLRRLNTLVFVFLQPTCWCTACAAWDWPAPAGPRRNAAPFERGYSSWPRPCGSLPARCG